MEITITELAKWLNAEIKGDGSGTINSIGPLALADRNTLSFMADDKHRGELKGTQAGALLVDKLVDGLSITQLKVKNVNAALIESLKIFAPKLEPPVPGIDASAKIGKQAKIGKNVSIGPFVVIENGAEIGNDTVIGAGCKIGQNTKVGSNCRFDSNIVIYHNCIIGNNVIIQANCVIGSTGFGYAFIEGAHRLIPHNGTAVIEDFVDIGANCCVDRAKFGETRIGAGTKIDNLVQIAHNVIIGKCCLIVSQVGISGSCKIGNGVVLAGQVGLADNIEIGDGAMVGAQAGVMNNIPAGKKVAWTPAIDRNDALHAVGHILRLPKLNEQFKQLTSRVEKLETTKDNNQPGNA